MVNIMICPFCKSDIEDNSIYCDQCGREIFICPKCGKPGKGKVCTSDGTALVSKKDKGGNVQSPLWVNNNVSAINPTPINPVSPPLNNPAASPVNLKTNELHLINNNLGLDLRVENGDIIGRTTGRFVDVFGQYQYVSGKHLQINYDPKNGWICIDMDSTFGTKYNNVLLTPNQPQILKDKSLLLIADKIEFYVQIFMIGKTGTRRI
ncbi:MAG: FHA domain-containing protein [Deltaproteobacteria bacterium]|nr:FHA domain-containing protein [Deltaproteobacteria bacterium]